MTFLTALNQGACSAMTGDKLQWSFVKGWISMSAVGRVARTFSGGIGAGTDCVLEPGHRSQTIAGECSGQCGAKCTGYSSLPGARARVAHFRGPLAVPQSFSTVPRWDTTRDTIRRDTTRQDTTRWDTTRDTIRRDSTRQDTTRWDTTRRSIRRDTTRGTTRDTTREYQSGIPQGTL